jgi:Zn-dependent metalloprotease
MPLNGIVHCGRKTSNAFWDGYCMNFGDGNRVLFNCFTILVNILRP